jgi:hypothetical protein
MVDQQYRQQNLFEARRRLYRWFTMVSLAVCLAGLIALLAVGAPVAVKASPRLVPEVVTVVGCSVTPATILTGKTAVFSVTVADVTNLYGYDVQMTVDTPASVQFTDADSARPGTNLALGTFLDIDHQFAPFNTINPVTGKIQVVLTVINPGPPSSGGGQLFYNTLTGAEPGTVHFTFDSVQLSDWPNALLIPNQTQGCTLTVEPYRYVYLPMNYR